MKKIIFLLFVFFQTINIFAQRNELGIFLGTSYYTGDLNPGGQFFLPKPALGFLYRYNINPRFAYKLNVYYGTVQGADSLSAANKDRNLSFKSPVLELSNQIELNFIKYVPGNPDYAFTPYIFTGFTVFYFDPMAKYQGKWQSLEPLGTEGQGTSAYPARHKYSRTNFAIPFGAGLKYNLSRGVTIGLEWGLRKTFTDYLDDVSTTYADPLVLSRENTPLAAALGDRSISGNIDAKNNTGLQRGNSGTKDWYSFAGIFITFKLKNKADMCPIYKQNFNYKVAKLYPKFNY